MLKLGTKCVHSSRRRKRLDAGVLLLNISRWNFMSLAEVKDYDGIVGGITEWGVFVEITEQVRGMIRSAGYGY
jgi:ribonuclease R